MFTLAAVVKLKVGQIVAAPWDDGEWMLAKVLKLVGDKALVEFKDGTDVRVSQSKCIVKPEFKKLDSKVYTPKDLKIKVKTDEDEQIAPPTKVVKKKADAPVVKKEIKKEKVVPEEVVEENDSAPAPKVAVLDRLSQAYKMMEDAEPSKRILYMKALWTYFNKERFDSKLKMPNFRFLKDMSADKMKRRGHWMASGRELAFSPRLFNADENFFNEIFLHEICHQAVTEIDKVYDRTAQGHGYNWQQWMLRVGLNPSRYDPQPNQTYYSRDEKEAHDKKTNALRQMTSIKPLSVVTVRLNGKLLTGIAAARTMDKRGNTVWAVTTNPKKTSHWLVKESDIFHPVEEIPYSTMGTLSNLAQKIKSYYERR